MFDDLNLSKNDYMKDRDTVEEELSEVIDKKVIKHRNKYRDIIIRKYMELLPLTISYITDNDVATSIDFLKMEVAFRLNYGFQPVIAMSNDGVPLLAGYNLAVDNINNPTNLLFPRVLTDKDIQFILPREKFPESMTEITDLDNAETGDFIVLKNKVINFISDYDIISHYADEMCEIISTRYSLIMQAKVNTFFSGEKYDEGINQIISNLFNGAPYIKTSRLFDFTEQMHTVDNSNLINALTEIKRQLQNSMNELNSFLGINSLGVDKTSGVSDLEAKSNSAFIVPLSNTYIMARQKPLDLLKKRFGIDIKVQYNDEVVSKLMQGGVGNVKDNDNITRDTD